MLKDVFSLIWKESILMLKHLRQWIYLVFSIKFITDYVVNSDLGIVKDRLIRKGSDIYKETTQESSEDAKSLQSDKD